MYILDYLFYYIRGNRQVSVFQKVRYFQIFKIQLRLGKIGVHDIVQINIV